LVVSCQNSAPWQALSLGPIATTFGLVAPDHRPPNDGRGRTLSHTARFFLVIDTDEFLPGAVLDDEAGASVLNQPGRREGTLRHAAHRNRRHRAAQCRQRKLRYCNRRRTYSEGCHP
jgi:hypothetical protein